jgi:drug/metabolite transporter (DMT)-like permease
MPMRFLTRIADQPYLLLTLTSLFWAGNAVVGRAVVQEIPPVALAEIRWIGAFLLLLPFAWPSLRTELPLIRRNFGILVVLSLAGISAFNTLLYWALQYTTAINATLMQSGGPLLIGLWSLILFRDPLTRIQTIGVLLSLAGVLVIVSGGDPARLASLTLNVGDLAVIVAMAIYALYSTLLRKRPGMTAISFAAVTIGLGALLLLPLAVAENLAGARFAPLNAGSLAALVYVIVFPSVLAYLCFNRGVQLIGANRAGPFFHLIPLFGALLAVVFLGERPGLHHGVGALLILGGVIVASRGRVNAARNRVAVETRRP